MTREEAIAIFKDWLDEGVEYDDGYATRNLYEDEEQAVIMAIKALSQEPTVTSTDEPMTMVYPTIICDDAINREAVIKDFTQWRSKLAYAVGEDYSGVSVLDKAIRVIKGMPSVTQKCEKCAMNGSGSKYCDNCGQKSGKWITDDAWSDIAYNTDFLEFLYNHINPNDMEHYRQMFEMKDAVAVNGAESEDKE